MVGGTNLAMVIEAALLKDSLQIDGLRDLVINTGKQSGVPKSQRAGYLICCIHVSLKSFLKNI